MVMIVKVKDSKLVGQYTSRSPKSLAYHLISTLSRPYKTPLVIRFLLLQACYLCPTTRVGW